MKNNKVHIAVIVVLLLIIMGTVSYAYFNAEVDKNGNTTASVVSKSLKIEFTDGPQINFGEMVPGQTIIKTFTVENVGNQTVNYNINLIDVINELSRTTDLVYTLTSTNSGAATVSETEFPSLDTTAFKNVSIAAGVTQSYTLTIVYKNLAEDQSVDMGSHINATIQIDDISNVIRVNASNIAYTNSVNPDVHTVADALDDLFSKLNQ